MADDLAQLHQVLEALEGNLTGSIYSGITGANGTIYSGVAGRLRFKVEACPMTKCRPEWRFRQR